jgi:hypothetical protein
MADGDGGGGGSSVGIVAIIAILVLVLVAGYFLLRGGLFRGGGTTKVEISAPGAK